MRRREQEPSTPSIETAFAKLEALLRKATDRTRDGLWVAVARAIGTFTPQEYANHFIAAGYEPEQMESPSGVLTEDACPTPEGQSR